MVEYGQKLSEPVKNYPTIKISSRSCFGTLNELSSMFFFIIKDIELERVNLKISTAIYKIVYQSSMVKNHRLMGIFLKKQDMSRLEKTTKR